MKKFRLAFCALISLLIIVPVLAELQNDDLSASQAGRKSTINQYEKVLIGNKTLTALDNQLKFLSDEPVGAQSDWTTANTTATNWKTTAGFSTREQSFLTTKLASKSDLPISSNILNNSIPKSLDNWWLSDSAVGDGTPKSFVDKDNGVDSGYTRTISAVVSGACGTSEEEVVGGLNTSVYTGFKPPAIGGVDFEFLVYLDITMEFYSDSLCSGSPVFTEHAYFPDAEFGSYVQRPDEKRIGPTENYSQKFSGPIMWKEKTCYPLIDRDNKYNTGWGMKRIDNVPDPDGYMAVWNSIPVAPVDCPAISVPASTALTRPIATIQSSIFSALTTPSTAVSSDGALGDYPDAGVGPYTLQVVESGLKVGLDSSDTDVTGSVIKHRDDVVQDGKITISYDMSGSSYESGSEVFISAISGGKYAKLGSVTQNGKGTVVLDINNLVTKTDGWIGPQDISVDLYQEEITASGKTNYISSATPITIKIIAGKIEQTPLVIGNAATVVYGANSNKFTITTTGGSGDGAMSYELVSGSEFASLNTASGEVTVVKPGTIKVKAVKASDEVYKASSNEKEITIQKAAQNLTITTTQFIIRKDTKSFQIETSERAAELTSALKYTLVSDGSGAASMSDTGLVTASKAGTIKVKVESTGNVNYLDGEDTKDIVIRDLPAQGTALLITNSDTRAYGDTANTFVVATAGGQGNGAITYSITAGEDVASVDQASKTVTISKVGSFTLQASKSGGTDYLDSVATLAVTVTKGKQEAFSITNLGTYLIDINPKIQITTNMKAENVLGKLTYTLTGEAFASIDTNGLITTKDEGTFTIRATSPGNEFYEEAHSDVKTIILTKRVAQTPLVITPPGKLEYSNNLKFQALTSGAQGSGALTYSITTGLNTVATVNSSTGEVSVVKPGTFTLNATKAVDNTYLESVASPIDVVVDKISQEGFKITTTGFVMKKDSTTFQVATTPRVGITSDLVYSLLSDGDGAASMNTSSGLVTAKKPGTIKVKVTSPGNDYYAVGEDTKDIVISELPIQNPALSITNKASRVYGEDANKFTIITDGGEGSGAITYEITTGKDVATVNQVERSVSILKVGTFTLQAIQSGGELYQDSIATLSITVTKAEQDSFKITNEDFRINSQATFEIAVTDRPTELTTPLVYDLGAGKGVVATISGNVVTPLKVGEIELLVTSMGNENYNNKEAKKTIQITDLPEQPAFRITNSKNLTYNSANKIMSITTDGGASDAGAITYSIQSGGEFATIADPTINKVTIVKPGTFTVVATKSGGSKYKNAVAPSEITVSKMSQSDLAISNVDVVMDNTKTFPITLTGLPSDLTKNYAYDITGKGDIANISNDTITPLKAGTITISVTSYGGDFYEDKVVSKPIRISELAVQNPALSILNSDTMSYNPSKTTFKVLTDGGQGEGAITYEISDGKGTIANIDGDVVNIIKPGSFHLVVTKDGGSVYKDSVAEKVILVNKAVQSEFKITNTEFMITDEADSFDLIDSGRPSELTTPLTYTIVEDTGDIASIVGKRITVSGSGTIKVSATSVGNDNYENKTAMATIVISELPTQAPLVISNNGTLQYGDNNNTFTLTSSGGSSESDVVFSLKSGGDVADLLGSNIKVKKVGTFVVTATKSGNATHKDIDVDKTFIVSKGKQKDFKITNIDVQFTKGLTIPITVSGRPDELKDELLEYALTSSDVATLDGDTITPSKTGTIEIQVTSLGNDNYDAAKVNKSIAITALPVQDPVVVINTPVSGTRVFDPEANTFNTSASGGVCSTDEITYDILAGKDSIASISGKKVTVLKPGKFTIQAKCDGGGTYQDSIATKEITVTKMVQSNFVVTNTKFILGSAENFEITTAGVPSDLTPDLTYSLSEGDAFATLEDDVVTPIKAGTIVVEVISKGNDFYGDKVAVGTIKLENLPNQAPFSITNDATMTYQSGVTSFAITTLGGSGTGAITYEVVSGDEFVKIDDPTKATVRILKPGNFTIKAVKSGADKYQDIEASLDVVFDKAAQSSFRITNGNFTIKNDAKSFAITTGGRVSGLDSSITYAISKDESNIASITDNMIEVSGVGVITVTATSLGNEFYKNITVEKVISIQALPIQEPALQINGEESLRYDAVKGFKLSLGGGEGNGAVSYEITSGGDVASVDADGRITYTKIGSFSIEVSKSGGDVFQDSVASKTFIITPGDQKDFAISNTDFIINSKPNFVLTTSGKAVEAGDPSFELISGSDVASLEGNVITPIKTGTIEVRATSPASANYLEKVVTKSIRITNLPAQSPAVSITNEDVTWGDSGNRMNITYSGGQGSGAVTYTIVAGNDVASCSGNVITILKAGTFSVHVKVSGNGVYSDSEDTKEIVVSAKDITITPNPIQKNVGQVWASVQDNGYEVRPALVAGDSLHGNAVYAYGTGVDDDSPAGSYKSVVSGLSNDNYNIQFSEGSLVVKKAVLSPSYFKVLSGTLGTNGWYTSDVVLTSLDKDGYTQLSDSSTFSGSDVLVSSEGVNALRLSLKNVNGSISEAIPYEVKIDKTRPIMNDIVLTEKNTGTFARFVNTITFGYWFDKEIEVSFDASDNMDGAISYLYQEEINGVVGEWKPTSSSISYGEGANVKVHVKAVDEAGNESVDTKVSELIQIDLTDPVLTGVSKGESYYLPRYVVVSDALSGFDKDASYSTHNGERRVLGEESLFNEINDIMVHVQDYAGNAIEVSFSILGLPHLDSLSDSDASRKIVSDVEAEYAQIGDKLDPVQRKEIEDWIKNAKDRSKKFIAKVEEPKTGIVVDGGKDVTFEDGVELIVEVVTVAIKEEKIVLENVTGIDEKDEIKEAYDIYLKKDEVRIQPSGIVKVKIPYTDKLKSYENIKVIYIDDNQVATVYPSQIEEEYITFETSHFSYYAIVGKKSPLNVDSDDDKIPDLNIDIDNDGKPDLNIDVDDDGVPDINIDTDFDGKADLNIDVNDDGVADVNIIVPQKDWKPNVCGEFETVKYCSNNELKAYINIDTDNDSRPDVNVDLNADLEPELNIDTGDDLIPDSDIDNDGDGEADVNIDLNGDGIVDKNVVDPLTSWNPSKDCEFNGFAYDTDASVVWKEDVPQGGNTSNGNAGNSGYQKPNNGGVGGVVMPAPTGDETNWGQWWLLLGGSLLLMVGTRGIKKRIQRKEE